MIRLHQQKLLSFEQKHQLAVHLKLNQTLDGRGTLQFPDTLQRIKIKERHRNLDAILLSHSKSPKKSSLGSPINRNSKDSLNLSQKSLKIHDENIEQSFQMQETRFVYDQNKTAKTITNATRTRNASMMSGLEHTESLNQELITVADELNEKNSVFSRMQLVEKLEVREIAYK